MNNRTPRQFSLPDCLSRLALVMACLLLPCGASSAQPLSKEAKQEMKKSGASREKPAAVAPTKIYLTTEFDSSIENLPPKFVGHNPLAILRVALTSPLLTKGEYETSAEFITRKEAWAEAPIFGALSRRSIFAFDFSLSEINNSGYLKYNADKEEMTLLLARPSFPIKKAITLASESKSLGSYVGTNAFGVSIKVTRSEVTQYGVFDDEDRFMTFTVQRDVAPEFKENLRVLFVGRLGSPNVDTEKTFLKATIDSPSEVFVTNHVLNFNIAEVIIFDKKTGKILHRSKGEKAK